MCGAFPISSKKGDFFLNSLHIFIGLFSYVGLSSEFAIGRIAETGTIGSYEKAFASKGKNPKLGTAISILPLIGLVLLTIGYAVVVAYIMKALFDSLTGTLMTSDVASWYEDLTNTKYSVGIFHLLVIILTLVNCLGSAKTLEKSSKFMMPAFLYYL